MDVEVTAFSCAILVEMSVLKLHVTSLDVRARVCQSCTFRLRLVTHNVVTDKWAAELKSSRRRLWMNA